MPAIKMKQPSQSGQNDHNGSASKTKTIQRGGQSLKQTKKRAKKNKKKAKAKRQRKKMNLPSRLSRIINYGAKKAQQFLTQTKSTIEFTENGVLTKSKINGEVLNNNGDHGPFLASQLSSTVPRSHQRGFGGGIISSSPRSSDDQQTADGESHRIPKDKLIALDCEMVGVGPQGRISALARCSMVDYNCNVVYDEYIKPELEIVNYRTQWSGIRKYHMEDAVPFREAQTQIQRILDKKILIGHAIRFDFAALQLGHPKNDVRDTSMYRGLQELAGLTHTTGHHPGLKKLTKLLFGHAIQSGEHCSVEDAKATMNLYKLVENQWEEERISLFPERDFKLSFMDDHYWPDDFDQ